LLLASPVWAQQEGEHHEHMARSVGKWKTVAKMWQMPGAPPTESEGTSEVVAVMDGRYFKTTYDGTFMGQPFNGMGIDGYDNIRKKHVGSWIDTMGTGIMNYEGTCSDDHKVLTIDATARPPQEPRLRGTRRADSARQVRPRALRGVIPVKDPDDHEFLGEVSYAKPAPGTNQSEPAQNTGRRRAAAHGR